MLQIVYISTAAPLVNEAELARILAVSRRNNARSDVTGLLFFNGRRFLQALEGPEAAVEQAIARIVKDARHLAVVRLSRRTVETRDFGTWAMESLGAGNAAAAIEKVGALTADASPNVRAQFNSFARLITPITKTPPVLSEVEGRATGANAWGTCFDKLGTNGLV